ncbi:hypothetical protein [Akkermansia muciniphila]|uniref:hypothetical protein n=1 Tax=Akkermansia muciniphila TaxID=239935 RepID=UPI001AAE9263|nr:hypothetical protein [Akkermansia muciniphila]QTE97573.1 hypothetical protein J4027_07850 [Akkermansia muciniphila]QTE99887.1 hypothetical protein J4Z33_07835 [Akkermansia muciniphila]QTF02198.1 hypothetical protein J4Z36_07835 [Akkermansia muciniphila]QTF04509.1 hypothetical protein J4Z34_07845 [Akkermansia muciniphila]
MLDFLGVTEHFSCMENTPFSFPALFRDMAGEAVSLDGVIFSGSIVSANQEMVEISIEKGESSNEVIFSFPALPEGRWSYNVLVQADDGSQRILFSGYISVLGVSRVAQLAGGPPMKNRTLLVAMPGEATMRLRMEWMATTAAQAFAYHALQASKNAHADAEMASQAAKTATDAAATAATRAEEAEGYAGSAWASKRAAADSATAAGTSATNAARDAKSANDAKTDVESLAATWPETVSNGEKKIVDAKNEAVTAIQDKQADSVLAVGRASQTAQQNIASAQADAVAAVQEAEEEAQGTITPLVQRAETAKEAIDQAEGRINTAATNAATSATSAANSATAAQQALEAIPQVDASGNMTLAGGLTAAGAINANGGVNIPLAVGAPTDTGAVNRLHAAGLAGVTDIFSQHAYLNTGSITATGTAATTALIPGQYAQVRVPAGTHSTIVFPFTGPNGQHNYSNFAGFSIPWRISGAGKITIGIGRGSKTTRSDLTQGSYSIIPGNNLAHNSGEILDITFDNVRDATRGGYVVKVREIYALSEAAGWRVKTTTSFVPATHNEPIPSIVNKIIYHQRTQYKFEREYISYGSLYLLTGGGQTVQLHKIAAVRGVNAFETGVGISSIVTDLPGNASGDVYMQVGSAVRTLYQPGNINPVYYALEALARNDIEAEETADFVDINIPL